MSESKTYMLTAHDQNKKAAESDRLESQYPFLKHAFRNQLLHPVISDLGPTVKVSDVGTVTGVWLNDLAKTLNVSRDRDFEDETRFVGFDIVGKKFSK